MHDIVAYHVASYNAFSECLGRWPSIARMQVYEPVTVVVTNPRGDSRKEAMYGTQTYICVVDSCSTLVSSYSGLEQTPIS